MSDLEMRLWLLGIIVVGVIVKTFQFWREGKFKKD